MPFPLGDLSTQDPVADGQIEDSRIEAKREALAQVMTLMVEHGLTPVDLGILLQTKKERVVARKVKAKYMDPATGSTWSGRGLKPRWLTAALQAGRSMSEFAL